MSTQEEDELVICNIAFFEAPQVLFDLAFQLINERIPEIVTGDQYSELRCHTDQFFEYEQRVIEIFKEARKIVRERKTIQISNWDSDIYLHGYGKAENTSTKAKRGNIDDSDLESSIGDGDERMYSFSLEDDDDDDGGEEPPSDGEDEEDEDDYDYY